MTTTTTTTGKKKRQMSKTRLTRTAPLEMIAGTTVRIKTVFGNRGELVHRWAANRQPNGRSGNMSFSGGRLYSYSTPIARHVENIRTGERFVMMDERQYSPTTASQKSTARQAVNHIPLFEVPNDEADTVAGHRENFRYLCDQAADSLAKSKRARTQGAWLSEQAGRLTRHANRYAELVGLVDRLDESRLEEWAEESQRMKAAEKAKQTAAQKKRAAQARAKLAAETAEWEQKLAAWKDGGDHPGSHPDRWNYRKAHLRIRGRVLETSERAAVPLRAALPLLEAIRNPEYVLPAGPDCKTYMIDDYALGEIDRAARTVRVGCHLVDFDEVLQLAERHGL